MRQLRGRCLRDELDAVFEPVRANNAMQQLGPQCRCDPGEALNELV
jgi:hypothetical protein